MYVRKQHIMERLVSNIYDFIITIIISAILIIGFDFINRSYLHLSQIRKNMIIIGICLIIYLFLYTILPLRIEGTIGKYIMELSIKPTKGRITFGRILFREVFLKHLLYFTVVGLIYELVFFIIKKQTVHDYYLKTTVEKKVMLDLEE